MTDPPSQESVYALLEGALPCKGSGSCVSYNFGCFKFSVCTKISLPREVLNCSNLPLRNVLVTANVSALTGFTNFARFSMSNLNVSVYYVNSCPRPNIPLSRRSTTRSSHSDEVDQEGDSRIRCLNDSSLVEASRN
jgi:hypothetical protein